MGSKWGSNQSRRSAADDFARRPVVTAVLVDGGFYRKRAVQLFGEKSPEDRAEELVRYSRRHISKSKSNLYRIFYYDCPPSDRVLYHPLGDRHINLGKSDEFKWMQGFLDSLVHKRKVALRRGEELETQNGFVLKYEAVKKLCRGVIGLEDLTDSDFQAEITQKGVDMRIGLDIATLAERGAVNQIVMITGDSDFVPAAKHARRAGIDFILDPMWADISDSLAEHVDGIRQCVRNKPENLNDPLHSNYAGPGNQPLDEIEVDEEV